MAIYYVDNTLGDDTWNGTSPLLITGTTGPVATIQQAVALAATGDTINVAGSATSYVAPTGGIIINKSLQINGTNGVTVESFSRAANQPCFDIQPSGVLDNVQLRRMLIQNHNGKSPNANKSGNIGIKCVCTAGNKVTRLVLEDLAVQYFGDDGICLDAVSTNDSFFVFVDINRVQSQYNYGNGLWLRYAVLVQVHGCYFIGNGLSGVCALNSETVFHGNAFENNQRLTVGGSAGYSTGYVNASIPNGTEQTFAAQLRLSGCQTPIVFGCHFEEFNNSWIDAAIVNGNAVTDGAVYIPGGTTVSTAPAVGSLYHTLVMSASGSPGSDADGTFRRIESVTINGTAYAGVQVIDSTVIVYGNYNQHAINLETCPGAMVAGCMFQNHSEPTDAGSGDAGSVAIFISSNGTGTSSKPDPIDSMVVSNRSNNVKTAIRMVGTAKNAAVWPAFKGSGTCATTLVAPNRPMGWN